MKRMSAGKVLFVGLLSLVVLGLQFDAMAQVSVTGQVLNNIRGAGKEYPISGVEVVVASMQGLKQISYTTTNANGQYTLNNLPSTSAPFSLTFTKREYFPKTELNVAAGDDRKVVLAPLGISTPYQPIAKSAPKSIYLQWDPNPEYNVKGYNVYRTTYGADAEGNLLDPLQVVENRKKINGDPNNTWDDTAYVKATSTEYVDKNIVMDGWYTYEIQAISGADRPSLMSAASNPPERGKWLTLFYPDVAIDTPGTLLWERTPGDPNYLEIVLPISTKSAYEVFTSAMGIDSYLPGNIIRIPDMVLDMTLAEFIAAFPGMTEAQQIEYSQALTDATVEVRPSGITAGMAWEANARPDGFDDVPEGKLDVMVSASDSGMAGRRLYGAGVLFYLVVRAKMNVEACEDLEILRNGTVLYEPDAVTRISFRTEKGLLCADTDCIHGDANNTGDVTADDVKWINRYWVKKVTANDCSSFAADVNQDGYIDAADATLIQRWIDGLDIAAPVTAAKADLAATSFAVAGEAEKALPVGVDLDKDNLTGTPGSEVTVSVLMTNAPQMAGFNCTVGFLGGAAGAEFVSASLGSGLDDDYSLEAGAEAGMTPDKGVVRVSASSIEAIEKTGEVALVNLVFRIGADNDGPVPVSLLSFSLSDQYGFSPRFDAPKAPIIGPKIVPPYIVPDVVGLTQAAAEAAINGIGLSVGTVTQQSSATVAAGNVISQDPVAGTSVEVTTLVNLVVSTGAPVTMYTLSVVLDGRGVGSVELNPGGGQYAAGTVVTLTATAADGSHFEGWGDALGNANPVTVTVNANTTVTAEFDKNGIICNRASISTGGANPGDLLLLGLVCALLLFAGKKSAVTARVEAN